MADNQINNTVAVRVQNQIVLSTALQLGSDILRELHGTGGLNPLTFQGEALTMKDVNKMLASDLTVSLVEKVGAKS